MRDQLIQYVNLLFAGTRDCEEIRQEILQNTLDRYDDLIAAGKVPEAAYRLAIAGIGDINEILGTTAPSPSVQHSIPEEERDSPRKKLLRAIAVALYILCPTPLFILSEFGMDTMGLCGTLVIVAVATVLIILGGRKESREEKNEEPQEPKAEMRKSISSLIGTVTLAAYLLLSFSTQAWFVTWLIFPLSAAIKGLVKAILDLKEAMEHEN